RPLSRTARSTPTPPTRYEREALRVLPRIRLRSSEPHPFGSRRGVEVYVNTRVSTKGRTRLHRIDLGGERVLDSPALLGPRHGGDDLPSVEQARDGDRDGAVGYVVEGR